MSDSSQGPGWWLASDGKWYPPEQVPGPSTVESAPTTPTPTVASPAPVPPVTPAPAAPVAPPPGATAAPPPGGYAAPPPTGYAAPPPAGGFQPSGGPPAQSSNGCLKAFLIVFAILAVLGIAAFVGLVLLAHKAVDTVNEGVDAFSNDLKAEQAVEDRTGISSNPFGFNETHPPQDDIKADAQCSTDSSGDTVAEGTVTNHSSQISTYLITVSFRQGGTEQSTGSASLDGVKPNETASWTANSFSTLSGSLTCKVTAIERFDTDTFGLTTTTTAG